MATLVEHNIEKMMENGEEDRISQLPDSVIHHILSFFDMKHVVQTSVLSTRWRLYGPLKHVDDGGNNYDFEKWILTALRNNVEDLHLDVYRHDFFPKLPHEYIFTCKSLRVLKLKCLDRNVPTDLNLPHSMSLPKLKTLVLLGFRIDYSESVASKIFSSFCCPVLESLTLLGCVFHKTRGLNISAPQLKHLVIINFLYPYYINEDYDGDMYPIKLYAPNLVSLDCKDRFLLRDYAIDDLSALVEAEIGLGYDVLEGDECYKIYDEVTKSSLQRMVAFMRAVHKVKTLSLWPSFLKVFSTDTTLLESTHIQFSNLSCLKLETWLSVDCINSITYLLKISPNIESLFLDIITTDKKGNSISIYPILDEVHWEAGLSLHHLKDVEIRGSEGTQNELMFLEILLKKAMVLKKVTVFTPKEQSPYGSTRRTKAHRENIVQQLQALPRVASSIIFTAV